MENTKPDNIVEKREGKDWGLIPPLDYDSKEFLEVKEDTLEIAQLAKSNQEQWPKKVLELLQKYTPWDMSDIPSTMAEFGFYSWRQIGMWIADDECVEAFLIVNKWSKRKGVSPNKARDFIRGEGMGVYTRLMPRMERTMEKVMDQKYFNKEKYKTHRPNNLLAKELNCNVECLLNYIHPGHPEDPTGHGGKLAESNEHANDVWQYDDEDKLMVRTFFTVATHARSAGPVHWLNSNLKAWALAGDKIAKKLFIRPDFK